ncbi:MAG: hypothetical protein D6746_06555 [Bacteroidetes bacterium]|nr:MAG: hypothetical protein D6746_06555 [Bacteroidota bacterium]
MIRDRAAWDAFEARWQTHNYLTLEERFRLQDELIALARALGAWPPEDPLAGLETDIHLARKLHAASRPSAP